MKKVRVYLALLFALILFVPTTYAISIDDLAEADETLTVEKNITGTSFKAGNTVNISSKIDGISFVAGNTINDSSESDYAFIAGNIINFDDFVTKDLFLAGSEITIKQSSIKRDAYIAAGTINFNGTLGRNLYAAGDEVIIDGTINGDVSISASTIKITKDAKVRGTLKYNDDAKFDNEATYSIKTKTYKSKDKKVVATASVTTMIFDILGSFANILVFGLLLLFVFKKLFDKVDSTELTASNVFKNIGIGLLILFTLPIVTIFLLISSVGVSTAFILIALFIIALYSSTAFTAYYFGKKVLNSKIDNDYLILTISLLVLVILNALPFIGSITTIASLLFGTGIFITSSKAVLFAKKKSKK